MDEHDERFAAEIQDHPNDFSGVYPEQVDGKDTGRMIVDIWREGRMVLALAFNDAHLAHIACSLLGAADLEVLPRTELGTPTYPRLI